MDIQQIKTPVLLIAFTRHETTQLVFNEIRKAKPLQLFFAVDGPRENVPTDTHNISRTRDIIKQIDWPCEVKTLFQEVNLGCGEGPIAAIDWFFSHVERGIILEDDCIPHPSFFYFCQDLLKHYNDSEKIMHISGNNFQDGHERGSASYYFSEYTHNWGWATWKRAWKCNDPSVLPPEQRKHIWDKQWLLAVKKSDGLAILPNVNLVSNIGFGGEATHTQEPSEFANIAAHEMKFPLIHPKKIKRDKAADYYTYTHLFGGTRRTYYFKKLRELTPQPLQGVLLTCRALIKKIWK
jgi:hypothetical protein